MTNIKFFENYEQAGVRFVGYAHHLNDRIDHNGWYINDLCFDDDVIKGLVVRLTGKNNSDRLLAGYRYMNDDGFCLDLSHIYTVSEDNLFSDRDVAYIADDMARITAEKERYYHSEWNKGLEYGELQYMLRDIREEWSILSIAKDAVEKPEHKENLLSQMRVKVEEYAKIRCKRAELKDSAYNESAFNEGASTA